MNGLDYAAIALIAFCALAGLIRGAIRMAASVASLVAGFYVASAHYDCAAEIARAQLGVGSAGAAVVGYAALFIAVFAVVQIVGLIVLRLMNLVRLGWVDRLAGAAIGAVFAAAIASFCVMILTAAMPPDTPILRGSRLAPFLLAGGERLVSFIPPEAKLAYERNRDELIKFWLEEPMKQIAPEPPASAPGALAPVGSGSTTEVVVVPRGEPSPAPSK